MVGFLSAVSLITFWRPYQEQSPDQDKEVILSIITDIDHCPSREAMRREVLDVFLREAEDTGSDGIVSLGDNASHRLRDCSLTADMDARFVADALRSTRIPAYFVLGDHDIKSSQESYESWLETSGRRETFYSFDIHGVHVVVLDTVLGGDPMSSSCEEKQTCASLQKKLADIKTIDFEAYREKYPESSSVFEREKADIKNRLDQELTAIKSTRSDEVRDKGRIAGHQIKWLEKDLAETANMRVVILSDHPLFPFTSDKKSYATDKGGEVRSILEKSQKEVVAISGEAHVWHEETINGIQYYIVNEFRQDSGSWAIFSWGPEGHRFEKRMLQAS